MGLQDKIQEDFKSALKGNDELKRSVFRMLKAALKNREIAKRKEGSDVLTDEEIVQVVQTEVKKRKEASAEYYAGNRPELAEKEKKEAEMLMVYLPEQISEEEIQAYAEGAIHEAGAQGMKDLGKVMGRLMPKLRGRADGAVIQRIVSSLLQGRNS